MKIRTDHLLHAESCALLCVVFALFLPVNGAGNNMNMTDAAAFAERTGAAVTVPLHVGMLDDKTAVGFAPRTGRVVIPEIYKEIKL